jgi:predicted cupin superfamily sugar epimerase
MTAEEMISALGLSPHPEGGHYREIYRHRPADGSRGASTAIYYLLRRGERSRWHRIDAVEHWSYHAGATLRLALHDHQGTREHLLGPEVAVGHCPQVVVPEGTWQTAASTGEWTLVGCIVAPAFELDRLEIAPEGWQP